MINMFKVYMSPKACDYVNKVMTSGHIAQGPWVDRFEYEVGEYLERSVLTVNSGTAALDLALHLAGVGPRDEVISTPQTCTASNSVIVNRGATIVWADINKYTGLLEPYSVMNRLTTKTKAIMAVDWSGALCDYGALKTGIPVIEDAAHAFGPFPRYARGEYICWSLQAIKHLTTGDGGLIHVPEHQQERARKLRWFGLDRRSSASFRCAQNIKESGYKYHMNDIAATMGCANLDDMPTVTGLYKKNAEYYHDHLPNSERIRLPRATHAGSAWWLYTLLVDDRPSFETFMKSRDIEVSQVHARNDRHDAFIRGSVSRGDLPGLEYFSEHQISIPVHWGLSESDRDQIIQAVTDWVAT